MCPGLISSANVAATLLVVGIWSSRIPGAIGGLLAREPVLSPTTNNSASSSSLDGFLQLDAATADCGHLKYNLALCLHNQDLGLTAIPPRSEGVQAVEDCPAFYLHDDIWGNITNRVDKWTGDINELASSETYALGSYSLSTILESLQRASSFANRISTATSYEYKGVRDVLEHDNVAFVLSMMQELDISLEARHVSWILQGLAKLQDTTPRRRARTKLAGRLNHPELFEYLWDSFDLS